jgi:hypothetical protein
MPLQMKILAEERPDIALALRRLISERDGQDEPTPTVWFDGFWDFFTLYRAHFERGTMGVSGPCRKPGSPWLAFSWSDERPHFEILMEAKDRRGGSRAPSPLSPRPVDAVDQRELEALGFTLELGYYGIHASLIDARHLAPKQLVDAFDVVVRVNAKLR